MKTKSDPTGQSKARRRAYKALSNRLTKAERRVKALFRSIPRKRRSEVVITNASEVFYDYDLSAFGQEQLRKEIEAILDQEVLETEQDSIPPFWWWEQYVEQPYRQGTLDEFVTFEPGIAYHADEIAKLKDALSRTQADFDNFQKRTERDRVEMMFFLKSDILKKLLPRVDDLERMIKNTPEDMQSGALYEAIIALEKALKKDLTGL